MIYGGVALIILGVLFLICNIQSFPFAIFLFVIGVILIVIEYKQRTKITPFQKTITKYHLNSSEAINTIYLLIEKHTNRFNEQNNVNIKLDSVVDLFFYRFQNQLQSITTKEVNNKFLGIMGYIGFCCILLSDKTYSKFKKIATRDFNTLIKKKLSYNPLFKNTSYDEILQELLHTMDDCYIDYYIEQLDKDNLKLPTSLNGEVLMQQTLSRFILKHNIKDEAF